MWFSSNHYMPESEDLGLRMLHVALIISAVVFVFVFIYWLMKCCEDIDKSTVSPSGGRQIVTQPVIAHEIEPGVYVLQSEDGNFLRILQEYNFAQSPPGTRRPDWPRQTETTHYLLHCTKPHYQNQASAPPNPPEMHNDLMQSDFSEERGPPSYAHSMY